MPWNIFAMSIENDETMLPNAQTKLSAATGKGAAAGADARQVASEHDELDAVVK